MRRSSNYYMFNLCIKRDKVMTNVLILKLSAIQKAAKFQESHVRFSGGVGSRSSFCIILESLRKQGSYTMSCLPSIEAEIGPASSYEKPQEGVKTPSFWEMVACANGAIESVGISGHFELNDIGKETH
jgi:hypothetical protein